MFGEFYWYVWVSFSIVDEEVVCWWFVFFFVFFVDWMFVENFVGFLDKFFEDFGDFFVFFVFLGEFLWWFFGFVWVVFFYVVVFCYVFEDEDGFVVGCVDEYEVNWEFDVFLNGFSKFVGFFSVYFFSVFVGYDFVFDGGEVNVEG